MNSFVTKLLCRHECDESSGDELFDKDAKGLSHVGEAVHQVLGRHHNRHHHSQWNVTSGKIVGAVDDTPKNVWDKTSDPNLNNDDWFPEKIADIISRTEAWCDVLSLGPPDGKFLVAFKSALLKIAERSKTAEKPIIVRMLFGNIAGMPVNCSAVIKALTNDLPKDDDGVKLHLWVGAWRRGFSWNHAKIIAVDGVYLHTGGHNLWDKHYLDTNPVHDLSFELEGRVARDGHRFANQQWQFIESKQSTCIGGCVDRLPDYLPLVLKSRVTVSEWPEGDVAIFPPQFTKADIAHSPHQSRILDKSNDVPLISIGRLGSVTFRSRPSDDAILAMINSSQKIIRLVLQDLGPVCIPGSKQALPGLVWPKAYLAAIGKAIYERGVDIEMVLSNPNSIPGGLKGTEANYGNGWSCVDVAAEIIKSIQKQHSDVDDTRLREMINENLRICFIRHGKSHQYKDGKSIGLHSKHFIVDNTCCYIGSQNLYMCDLAEWGIVVDSEVEVKKIMNDYFVPMWENSFTGKDVDVEKVMDGLKVDRDGEHKQFIHLNADAAQEMMPHGTDTDYYTKEEPPHTWALQNPIGNIKGKSAATTDAKEDGSAVASAEQPTDGEDGDKSHTKSVENDEAYVSSALQEEKDEPVNAPPAAVFNEGKENITSRAQNDSSDKVREEETPQNSDKEEDVDEESLAKQSMKFDLDCCGLTSVLNIASE